MAVFLIITKYFNAIPKSHKLQISFFINIKAQAPNSTG